MSDTPATPEHLARFYADLRRDILRIDKVYDEQFGMGCFICLNGKDPGTGKLREILLEDVMKKEFQLALAREWVAQLSVMCPRALVRVFPGSEALITFTRESPLEVDEDEIWNAFSAFDKEWARDLCSNAYEAMLDELARPRLSGRPALRTRPSHRRRR